MPLKKFSGELWVELRDVSGNTDSYSIPVVDGTIIAKPYRKDGPPTRELLNGTRRERRAMGWHIDFELSWDNLSDSARADVRSLIEAMHDRGGESIYVVLNPILETGRTERVEVVPHITDSVLEVVYENRLRKQGATLKLLSKDYTRTLPDWLN